MRVSMHLTFGECQPGKACLVAGPVRPELYKKTNYIYHALIFVHDEHVAGTHAAN